MRKLIILKSLVDFIWIVTCIPLIPILLFFSVYIFIDEDIITSLSIVNHSSIDLISIWDKLFVLLLIILTYIIIYCFYLFRKTLRAFQQRKPFSNTVIENFNRIGNLLIISGISFSALFFIFRLVFKNKIEISLGITPYVGIVCLGLFFLVLSEVFKIAKIAKEENELTV